MFFENVYIYYCNTAAYREGHVLKSPVFLSQPSGRLLFAAKCDADTIPAREFSFWDGKPESGCHEKCAIF